MPWGPFVEGTTYSRRADIHGRFGGQQQGGICTPAGTPVVILFTGEGGMAHGYADGWTEDGTFRYFGEGQVGDMTFVRGNKAIRDHQRNGRDVLLFKALKKRGRVQFLGQFTCAGYSIEPGPDRDGTTRQAIVFSLVPPDGEADVVPSDHNVVSAPEPTSGLTIGELRKRAFEAASSSPEASGKAARRSLYRRSKIIRDYVLRRAGGACEACGSGAPFEAKNGEPYLEPHHIRRLTDGGPDDPRHMAALCPNCHREVHYGIHGDNKNETTMKIIIKKESVSLVSE